MILFIEYIASYESRFCGNSRRITTKPDLSVLCGTIIHLTSYICIILNQFIHTLYKIELANARKSLYVTNINAKYCACYLLMYWELQVVVTNTFSLLASTIVPNCPTVCKWDTLGVRRWSYYATSILALYERYNKR